MAAGPARMDAAEDSPSTMHRTQPAPSKAAATRAGNKAARAQEEPKTVQTKPKARIARSAMMLVASQEANKRKPETVETQSRSPNQLEREPNRPLRPLSLASASLRLSEGASGCL